MLLLISGCRFHLCDLSGFCLPWWNLLEAITCDSVFCFSTSCRLAARKRKYLHRTIYTGYFCHKAKKHGHRAICPLPCNKFLLLSTLWFSRLVGSIPHIKYLCWSFASWQLKPTQLTVKMFSLGFKIRSSVKIKIVPTVCLKSPHSIWPASTHLLHVSLTLLSDSGTHLNPHRFD